DAAAADHHHRAETGVSRREREREWPPVVMGRTALPAGEVGRDVVATRLEQQHVAAALGQLACDDAAAGSRTHDHHFQALAHPTPPRYDQSFLIRIASGEWKSISSYALGPLAPGATKSL